MATEDTDAAIRYLRRAMGVDPYSRASTESLEDALIRAERWDELDRLYRQALAVTMPDDEREALLRKRTELVEHRLEDREELKRCLEQLAALHPIGSDPYQRLHQLYPEDQDWSLLARLLESEIDALDEHPTTSSTSCSSWPRWCASTSATATAPPSSCTGSSPSTRRTRRRSAATPTTSASGATGAAWPTSTSS